MGTREGRFVRRTWGTQSLLEHSEGAILPPDGCATRPTNTDTFSSDETSPPPAPDTETLVETAGRRTPRDRSDVSQKGYWDIMSIFRSGNTKSGSWPRSRSGHP